MSEIFKLSIESIDREELETLAELIAELGFKSKITSRMIGKNSSNTVYSETRLGKLILSLMDTGRSYESDMLEDAVEAAGYKRTSVSPTLFFLEKERVIKKISRETWQKS